MQLVYDEEVTVKISSINLLIRILDLLDKNIKEKTISNLIMDWMDSHEVLILDRISAIFGVLLERMSDIFILNKQRLSQTI